MNIAHRLGLGLSLVFAPASLFAACTVTTSTETGTPDSGTPSSPADGGSTGDASTPGDGASASDAGLANGAIRELSLHQLTVLPEHKPAVVPAFSVNGARIAFSVREGGAAPNRIFVVDADGSNVKQVDSYAPLCGCNSTVAISDDGNTVASTDGVQTRVVDLAGTLKNSVILSDGVVAMVKLTANGSDVFTQHARNAAIVATGVPLQRGIYKMSAGGGAPVQIISPQNVATAIGGATTADDVFPFAGCVAGMAISSDGAKVVAATYVAGAQAIVSATGAGGATTKVVIPPLTEGGKLVINVGLSPDGSKVAYFVQAANPSGSEVGVIGFDGTGRKKLAEVGHFDSCSAPLTFTTDGSLLAIGNIGSVYPTDGSEPWPVLAPTGASPFGFYFLGEPDGSNTRDLSMSGDGKRFVFLNSEGGGQPRHIGIAELNATALGAVPKVSAPTVSRPSITRDTATTSGTKAKLTAKAPAGAFVGGVMFIGGALENTGISSASVLLRDDGKDGDTTANDGTYESGERVTAGKDSKPGKRVLRIKAETKDTASGKRSAHLVDFGPFAVE